MAVGTRAPFDVRHSIGDIIGVKGAVTQEQVRAGLPAQSIVNLGACLQITQGEMFVPIDISKQTFQRRLETGLLNKNESDRVVRYAQLLALATELFEDSDEAARWLKTPAPALGNDTPMVHAETEMGARNVERLIGRLEHGIPT